MGDALDHWDISRTNHDTVRKFFMAAPGGVRSATAFSQNKRYAELDLDREDGVIRSARSMPFSKDGGLAVLKGNIALDGCIVKTAGVDEVDPEIHRPGAGVRKPGRLGQAHPDQQDQGGRRGGDPLRRAAGRAGHAGNAVSDQLSEIEGAGQGLRAA